MKKIKRFVSFLLAMVMVMAMSMTAMAATITIKNPVKDQTYNVYKIFDVTENADKSSYAYTIKSDNAWYQVVNEMAGNLKLKLTAIEGTSNPIIYNVTRDTGFDENTFAKTFAEKLNEKLEDTNSNFTPTESGVGPESGNLEIAVTEAGYYFVDSSLGSLCFLNTTDATADISEKNSTPKLEKKVWDEDSSENSKWSDKATADISEKVQFKLTANTGNNKNANPITATGVDADYVITDTLPAGMDFVTDDGYTLKVYTLNNVSKEVIWNVNTDYEVTVPTGTSKNLVITLKASKLKDLNQNTDIIIEYYALLNSSADIGDTGNKNTAKLEYKNYETPETTATVYSYGIEVFKYTKKSNSSTETPLSGAEFMLYKTETVDNSSVTKYAKVENNKLVEWTTNKADAIFTTPGDGKFKIEGLDVGTYYLVETKAPAGYNRLNNKVEVKVTAKEDNSAKVEYKMPDATDFIEANTQIKVLNQTGAVLPSTGGMGTTIFYVAGGLMVAVAGVLLVTRKRMNAQEK